MSDGSVTPFREIVGERFGMLLVFERTALRNKHQCAMYRCRCDCGTEKLIVRGSLTNRLVTSCGCQQNKCKHGGSRRGRRAPEYRTWESMLARCYKKDHHNYERYGARGISVCNEWQGDDGFANFLSDMGPQPTPEHSIDRINNDAGYSPDNCRWATPKEQARNRRSSVVLTHAGRTRCVSEWAEVLGVNVQSLFSRIGKGWSAERVLATPIRQKRPSTRRR